MVQLRDIRPCRRGEAVVVTATDGSRWEVDPVEVRQWRLESGMQVDSSLRARLDLAAQRLAATRLAIRWLAHRARTTREIRQRLHRRGFEEGIIETVIDGLQEKGLLDDEAFAESWVRGRLTARPTGARRLRQELVQQGIAPSLAEEKVRQMVKEEDEDRMARQAALRAWARYRGLDHATRRRRLAGYLRRRGFGWELIAATLRELEDQERRG